MSAAPSRTAGEGGSRGSLIRSALVLTSGRAIAYLAGFFVPIILVRQFVPAEFGTYKQAFLLFETLFFITQLGLANSLYYFVPQSGSRAGRYVANALAMLAVTAALAASALLASRDAVAALFSGSSVNELLVPIAIYLASMLVAAPLEVLMIARHRIRSASLTYALSDALRAACLILPALLTRDIRAVLYCAAGFALVRAIATLVYVRREFGAQLRLDAGLARAQLAYSLPFALAVVLGTIQLRFHEFAVSHNFDAATYAIYALGCMQIPLIDFISSPTSDLMMVRMTEALGEGRPEAARASWFDAVSGLSLVFVPLVGLLVLEARELFVLLFTSAYAGSVPIFQLWALTILLVPLLTDAALRVYAETRFLVLVNLAQLVVLLATIGPLISRFGLPGAVLSTALAMIAGRAISLLRIRQRLGHGPVLPWREMALVVAAAALAYPFGWAAKWTAGGAVIPGLVLGGAAYVAAYAFFVWLWGLAPELTALARRTLARCTPRTAESEAGA